MMKKLLITGSGGFLGSRAAAYFNGKYHLCTPKHREMDITDRKSVEKAFVTYKPDVVIHCAAISDVGRCEKEPEMSWNINVNGCINMAHWAEKIGAKCIICSSDQVYFGSKAAGAHKEEEHLLPHNLYGRQKLAAEEECLKVNPDCVLLRLSWMYDTKTVQEGEHGDFMRTFLAKIGSEEDLCYPIWDVRGISNVNEVIQNLEATFGIAGGVYNFGSPNDRNMYETMKSVFENLSLDLGRLKPNKQAFQDNPRNISMDQDKIRECGIVFSSTIENLTKHIGQMLKVQS